MGETVKVDAQTESSDINMEPTYDLVVASWQRKIRAAQLFRMIFIETCHVLWTVRNQRLHEN